MTILRARATPFAAALCLALAAPAADAAGFMYFKDSPIVGELPPPPPGRAAPTQPGTPSAGAGTQGLNQWRANFGQQAGDGDSDGRDFLIWQRGSSPNPKAPPGPAQTFRAPGKPKLK